MEGTILESGESSMKKHNKEEARILIKSIVNKYEKLSYEELRTWAEEKKIKTEELNGPSGVEYQIELAATWDDKRKGTIRFSGAIYDGSSSRLFGVKTPIGYDFLKEK
jgi:hypothetical protein